MTIRILKKEFRSFQHFLVDSELEEARHKVFNYAVENLNETVVNEKLDHYFNNLIIAVKVNLDLDSNSNLRKMENSTVFKDTKTKSCWPDRNMCAQRMILQGYKLFSTKLTSSCPIVEKQ